ncbi:MAG: type II toxin-antitoxin system RelB/DinJ family antitoxin [Salinisphaera sp.]|nr:type II toxin-antitoxin system RelB/DinJ family antitoxin [Salinisphaera sp.]
MNKTVDVRARIGAEEKQRASDTLASMGLTVSQAIRLFLNDVAETQSLPFEIKTPNRQTVTALKELDRGDGQTYESVDEMFDTLSKD